MDINGINIELDKDGYMVNPELWNEDVARAIALEEGIDEMSETHWTIVMFIRNYWLENNVVPEVRLICKEVGIGVREIFRLFTTGPARGACRVAGLPKPESCV